MEIIIILNERASISTPWILCEVHWNFSGQEIMVYDQLVRIGVYFVLSDSELRWFTDLFKVIKVSQRVELEVAEVGHSKIFLCR